MTIDTETMVERTTNRPEVAVLQEVAEESFVVAEEIEAADVAQEVDVARPAQPLLCQVSIHSLKPPFQYKAERYLGLHSFRETVKALQFLSMLTTSLVSILKYGFPSYNYAS